VTIASTPASPGEAVDRAAWRQILADVAVVTVTPFAGERLETVDHDGLARNLERVLGGGARLLVAGGNTGEFARYPIRRSSRSSGIMSASRAAGHG
jgi:hypothetical protein